MSSAVSTTADRTTSRTEPPGHHSCGLRCRQLPEALSYFSPDALLHASGARPRRQCLAGARCPVRVELARGRQPMGDNYVRPLTARKFCGSMSKYRFNLQARRRTSIRRRHSPAPSNTQPRTLRPQHLCQPLVLRGARGGAALLDLQLDGGTSSPGHTRLHTGREKMQAGRAGMQAGASGVAGGSSVCSPIS